MYKRLLVPTDGSELSLDAVRGAASFAEAMHSEVVLITVIEPYSYTSLSEYRSLKSALPKPAPFLKKKASKCRRFR